MYLISQCVNTAFSVGELRKRTRMECILCTHTYLLLTCAIATHACIVCELHTVGKKEVPLRLALDFEVLSFHKLPSAIWFIEGIIVSFCLRMEKTLKMTNPTNWTKLFCYSSQCVGRHSQIPSCCGDERVSPRQKCKVHKEGDIKHHYCQVAVNHICPKCVNTATMTEIHSTTIQWVDWQG